MTDATKTLLSNESLAKQLMDCAELVKKGESSPLINQTIHDLTDYFHVSTRTNTTTTAPSEQASGPWTRSSSATPSKAAARPTKPAFQRPTNPQSSLLAIGRIEQQHRGMTGTVWKDVFASLVEGRNPGEETTLWIQREVVNASDKTELEVLQEFPLTSIEEINHAAYPTDNRFSLKISNVANEFVFRCPNDEDAVQDWVLTLRSAREVAPKKSPISNNQGQKEEEKKADEPKPVPATETPFSKPRMSVHELRALAHGAGINTQGMERGELEAAVAKIAQPIASVGTAAAQQKSEAGASEKLSTEQLREQERRRKSEEVFHQQTEDDTRKQPLTAAVERPSSSSSHRMSVHELRAIAHGAGINTQGMERGELVAAVALVTQQASGGAAPQQKSEAKAASSTLPTEQLREQERRSKSEEVCRQQMEDETHKQPPTAAAEPPSSSARVPVHELRALAHGAGINTQGMERGELEAAVAKIAQQANGGVAAQQKSEAEASEKLRKEREELERRRTMEEEASRRRVAEEAARRAAEDQKRKNAAAEEHRRRMAEMVKKQQAAERRKKEEAERLRLAEERRKRDEEERRRRETEQRAAEEKRRQEEAKRLQQQRWQQQQQAWRKQAEDEQRTRREAERRADEERRRQEEVYRRQHQKQEQWQHEQQHVPSPPTQQQQQSQPSQPPPWQRGAAPQPPPGYGQAPPNRPFACPPPQQQQPPQQQPPQQQQPPPPTSSPINAKYAKMAHKTEDDSQLAIHHVKHGVLVQWALLPPMLQVLRPIEQLITTIQTVFPPRFGVPGHAYFSKWKVITLEEVSLGPAMGNRPDDKKLEKAVRKLRFFLHSDRWPRDFNREQKFLCKMLWDITSDAWEEHKQKEEVLGWARS